MKCPMCGGTGEINVPVTEHLGRVLYGKEQCDACDGTGEVQTNEEWMKSLNTEELVDHLYEVHKGGASVERQAWIEKHKERIKMQIRGWLKQPHTIKEIHE